MNTQLRREASTMVRSPSTTALRLDKAEREEIVGNV